VATTKNVPIELPVAQDLAELHAIRNDLHGARDCCERVIAAYRNVSKADPVTSEALCTTAVIKYARCFSSGVRPKILPHIEANFSAQQMAVHTFAIEYRNKFLAHSVNPYEHNRATIVVPEEPPADWVPKAIGYHHSRPIALNPDYLRQLHQLATWVENQVEQLVRAREPAVLAELAKIPAARLAALDVVSSRLIDWSDVDRRR
jgi:hypothetical protein